MKGVLGIGLAFVLLASLMTFAIPVSADPVQPFFPRTITPNTWEDYYWAPGVLGGWFFDPAITKVGPLAKARDGDLYAYVEGASAPANTSGDIFMSSDGGRTWAVSPLPLVAVCTQAAAGRYNNSAGGAVVDMVCSSEVDDIIYVTDGNYVYKSIDGGVSYAFVAPDDLENNLMGRCGITITDQPITCIDVGYDNSGKPFVFIGTKNVGHHFPADHPLFPGDAIVGSVYWIADETWDASWADLELECYGCCDITGATANITNENIGTGNGTKQTFTATLVQHPVVPGDIIPITVDDPDGGIPAETFTDPEGDGTLAGDAGGTGTIDYATGALSVTFNAAPDLNDNIQVDYGYYTGGGDGCFDVYAVGCAPDFDTSISKRVYVVITTDDLNCDGNANDPETSVIYTEGGECAWHFVSELCWNCDALNKFQINHASKIVFPSYYEATPTLFVGVTAWNGSTTNVAGGDVYRVPITVPATTPAIDLNVQGFSSGCLGLRHANICSLDIENNALVAGAWDDYEFQSPVRVYYSADGGWIWTASLKDPTGENQTYVLFGSSILAATNGCDCALSHSCGTPLGAFFNQISLINTDIEKELDLSFSPEYFDGSSTMYELTYCAADDSQCAGPCLPADAFTLTAGADASQATVKVNTGSVSVTVVTEAGATPITITPPAVNPGTWTIDFPDSGDVVLVTATSNGTNVTVTEAAALTVAYSKLSPGSDCDGDMVGGGIDVDPGVTFDMPDGLMGITSLFRWDGTYMERVHSSRYYLVTPTSVTLMTGPLYDWVEVSPDFNNTSCVYLANTSYDMARSLDAGCSWAPLTFPCAPKPTISAWIVVDLETVLASGGTSLVPFQGTIYRTTYHGTQPWDAFSVMNSAGGYAGIGVDFDLSPNITNDNSILFGDAAGQVYISEDLGMTWYEIEDALTTTIFASNVNTYVVFDPGYGTADDPGEHMIYAAAGTDIGRCDINPDAAAPKWVNQDWVEIFSSLVSASGIDAAGDTALYVSDRASVDVSEAVTVSGTIEISCYWDCCGGIDLDLISSPVAVETIGDTSFIDGELVEIIEDDLTCTLTGCEPGVEEPDLCACTLYGVVGIRGYESGAFGYIEIDWSLSHYCVCEDCISGYSFGTVLSSFLRVSGGVGAVAPKLSGVERSLNPMDPVLPVNTVVFERLTTPTNNPVQLEHPVADTFTPSIYPDDLWLTIGSNMLWALDSGTVTAYWVWDDPLATPVIQSGPDDGKALVTPTMATLKWKALDLATEYEISMFSYCPTCPDNMEPMDPIYVDPVSYCVDGVCCYVVTGLTPGTTYYWKVRVSEGEPYLSKWSELWSFDTAMGATEWCSPRCGEEDISLTPNFSWDAVVGATEYEIEVSTAEDFATLFTSGKPKINAWDCDKELEYSTTYYWRVRAVNKDGVPGAWMNCLFSTEAEPTTPAAPITPVTIVTEEITPVWIWVIIGIGAALVIAVIVLIVTTRRVS
jgi:hypothetical protein